MRLLPHILLLAAQLSVTLALPAPASGVVNYRSVARRSVENAAEAATTPAQGAGKEASKEAGKESGKEKEEKKENEVEMKGQFGTALALGGGNVKTDVLFPAGKNGVFEVEFKNAQGRTLTVTENKTPAKPPSGFVALEPVSYKVQLAEGASNLTLQQIDYIRNANSTVDIRNGKIGRLCTEVNAFVIDAAVGELEFEEEENELKLVVKNMNAEWAVFLPQAAGGAGAGAGAEAGAGAGTGSGASAGQAMLDRILKLLDGLGKSA